MQRLARDFKFKYEPGNEKTFYGCKQEIFKEYEVPYEVNPPLNPNAKGDSGTSKSK